jgi:hypothetical protein
MRLEAAQAACDDRTSGPWHYMQYGKLGDDLVTVGRIMLRGEAGVAAYDTNNRLVGNFPDGESAAAALFALVPQAKKPSWLEQREQKLSPTKPKRIAGRLPTF